MLGCTHGHQDSAGTPQTTARKEEKEEKGGSIKEGGEGGGAESGESGNLVFVGEGRETGDAAEACLEAVEIQKGNEIGDCLDVLLEIDGEGIFRRADGEKLMSVERLILFHRIRIESVFSSRLIGGNEERSET